MFQVKMALSIFVFLSVVSTTANAQKEPDIDPKRHKVERLYSKATGLIDKGGRTSLTKARQVLEELIELDPNFPQAYLELARIEMKSKWPDGLLKAEKQILIAQEINPHLADTNILLGYVHTNFGRYEKAEELYKTAEQGPGNNLWLYANRGLNFQKQGLGDLAIESYRKVLIKRSKYMSKRNMRVREWVYKNSNFFALLVEQNLLYEADHYYTANSIEFPEHKCAAMRQAKFRLETLNNVSAAIFSALKARKAGCQNNTAMVSIAYYHQWLELSEESTAENAASAIALRKATALAPDTPKLVIQLLDHKKGIELIEKIGDLEIDSIGSDGYTALSLAVFEQDINKVQSLLDLGASANLSFSPEDMMKDPLVVSIMYSNKSIVELLLKHGANPDRKINGGYKIRDLFEERGYSSLLNTKQGI